MWMAWGPELTFFCNDAYRRDTLGRKYPWALGRPAREVWAEIWPEIGPRIDRVMATGEATWDEALLLFLERSGYREETYHTFSYSPLMDDDGKVVGMLCVVSEDTERVIGARQMATVRDVGASVTALRSEEEVLAAVSSQLAADRRSVPGAWSTCSTRRHGSAALLSASAGVPAGHPVAVPVVDVAAPDAAWPVPDVLEGRTMLVGDLPARFGPDVPAGAWPEPPLRALAVPLRAAGRLPAGRVRRGRPQPLSGAGRRLPGLRRAARRPDQLRARPARVPTRRSASGPSGCSSSTGPRPSSSPTSATSSAPR